MSCCFCHRWFDELDSTVTFSEGRVHWRCWLQWKNKQAAKVSEWKREATQLTNTFKQINQTKQTKKGVLRNE